MASNLYRQATAARVMKIALILAGTVLMPEPVAADDERPVVVLCSSRAIYHTAAEALTQQLRARGRSCEHFELPSDDPAKRKELIDQIRAQNPEIIAAAGAGLTAFALEAFPEARVVYFLAPNALDAAFLSEGSPNRQRVLGVTSDIAPGEQLRWFAQIQPACRSIAVLHSERSQRTARAIAAAGDRYDIVVKLLSADRDHFPDAIERLNASGVDGVLMIPDARVYNSPNVQRLLLWGVRRKKGVFAFSDKVVKAGALAGLSADPAGIGADAADLILDQAATPATQPAPVRYPSAARRSINLHTAKTIGTRISDRTLTGDVTKFGEP